VTLREEIEAVLAEHVAAHTMSLEATADAVMRCVNEHGSRGSAKAAAGVMPGDSSAATSPETSEHARRAVAETIANTDRPITREEYERERLAAIQRAIDAAVREFAERVAVRIETAKWGDLGDDEPWEYAARIVREEAERG